VRVDCAGLSDTGAVRTNNEDHFLIARFGRFLTPLASNIPGHLDSAFAEEGHGLVVADGMGGAAAGELASTMAIQKLLHHVFEMPDWIISTDEAQIERMMQRTANLFRQIDQNLLDEASRNSELRGMGTTMTLAFNIGDTLVLTHIGDSRAYLLRGGALHQLTHDHTLAQSLVDQGVYERSTDVAKPLRNTLVRALGGVGSKGEAEVQHYTIFDQDVLLLCTDGLTDMVGDKDIAATLGSDLSAQETCKTLVNRALANGGKDNVTVIVARYAFFSHS
jgi:protein phosphatase